jgi:putative RecB family exonuclease
MGTMTAMTTPVTLPLPDLDVVTGVEPVNSLERLPKRISPSRAKDFAQCPRLFYYKTILGIPTPNTLATAKGTIAHTAFERLFDHPREDRTPATALSYVAPAWEVMTSPLATRKSVAKGTPEEAIRNEGKKWREEIAAGSIDEARALRSAEDYQILAPPGSEIEAKLIADASFSVENYFTIERPWNFDPVARELHLEAETLGVSMHGFIDRLDKYTAPDGEERWVIADFKTGKVPQPRYLDEAFFALKIYAVLLAATMKVMPYSLRLIYVSASKEDAIKVLRVDQQLLDNTQRKMKALWNNIKLNAREETWAPKKGPLCKWCHFQDICPAFHPELKGIVDGAPEPVPVVRRRRAN